MSLMRSKLVDYLNDILLMDNINDPFYDNGLIIEGKKTLKNIVLTQNINNAVINYINDNPTDMVISHYGLFYKKQPIRIKKNLKKKLLYFLSKNINYYNAYLPLIQTPTVGKNYYIARSLGIENLEFVDEEELLLYAELKNEMHFDDIVKNIERTINGKVFGVNFHNTDRISTVAISTVDVDEVIYKVMDADLFITSYLSPIDYIEAQEYGMNIIYIDRNDLDLGILNILKTIINSKYKSINVNVIDSKDIYLKRINSIFV